MDDTFRVTPLEDGIWALSQRNDLVRSFLLVGKCEAILVDTCFGGNIRAVCESLTDCPITLVNTHDDIDHIGCNDQFERRFMHPAEYPRYLSSRPAHLQPEQIVEGGILSADPFRLEAVHLPGHTPGSIALLDRENRFLIGGDIVLTSTIYLFGPARNRTQYRQSLQKLWDLSSLFDTIYASHGQATVSPERILKLMKAFDKISSGVVAGQRADGFPPEVQIYETDGCAFYLNKE